MKLVKNAENLTPDKNISGVPPTRKVFRGPSIEELQARERAWAMDPERHNFEPDFIYGAATDPEFFEAIRGELKPVMFENIQTRQVYTWIVDYYREFNQIPPDLYTLYEAKKPDLPPKTAYMIDTILRSMRETWGNGREFDPQFYIKEALKFCSTYRAKQLIEEGDREGARLELNREIGPVDNDSPIFLTDLLTIEIPERQMIVHPFLKEASQVNIYGEKGRGKSLFIHSLAHAITSETEFGPWPIVNNVPCAIIDGELDLEDLRDRFIDITPNLDTKHLIMIISNAQRVLASKPIINLLDPHIQGWLLAQFLKFNIKVVFFDNLSCLAPGLDENAKRDYDPINQFRLNLKHHGIANNLIHHLGKTEKQRGTSGRDDNVDTIMMLKKLPGWSADQGAVFNIEFEKARVKNDYLHLIRPMEARYMKDPAGENVWVFSADIMTEKRLKADLGFVRLAECLKAGKSQEDMAKIFNKDQTAISRWLKTMYDAGHLDKTGKGGHTKYILNGSGESLFNEYSKV
jgi:hypothetical protein